MKKLVALVLAMLVSTSFATSKSDLSKINAISNAWKSDVTKHPETKNDITMVYGGSDVNRPMLHLQAATA